MVVQANDSVFKGLGCLDPPVSFKVNNAIPPVQMPIHRLPAAKREKEKATLDRYVALGIIQKVDEPTPWCSNPIIVETLTKFCICLEQCHTINRVIECPIFQMSTLAEHQEGFLQCPLDEPSSFMTTMHTSFGRYRWLRKPFGVNSAPEEFQMRIAATLESLEGVISIADDILVYGEGNTDVEASIDHDQRTDQQMIKGELQPVAFASCTLSCTESTPR